VKKQTLAATSLSVLLLTALAGVFLLKVGLANPYVPIPSRPKLYVSPPNPAAINVLEPQNSTSYKGTSVTLRASITNLSDIYAISCYLDKREISISQIPSCYVNLTNLSEGKHTIKITVSNQRMQTWHFCYYDDDADAIIPAPDRTYSYVVWSDSEVSFVIDNTSPRVSISSPQEQTYSSDVILDFKVDEPTSQVAYSLDEQANVTISGNTKITGLSDCAHSLILYAWDTAGNVGASEPVTFKITVFPTTLAIVIVILVSVVAASAGLLFYFKKRKR